MSVCSMISQTSLSSCTYNQREYSTFYMQQTVTYICIPGYIKHHQYLTDNVGVLDRQQARDLSVQWDVWNPTSGRLWPMNDCPTYLSLMHKHRHVQVDLDLIIDDFVSRRNRRLDFLNLYNWKTLINSWWIKVQRVTSIIHVFCYPFLQ